MNTLDVLFAPAEIAGLAHGDLSETCCVVFDILRATSTMISALWHGAAAILPVEEIADALAARQRHPDAMLAGERDGVRIGRDLTGGAEFDLGNSPREFTAPAVHGKTIVMSTTNGTRALRACLNARTTLAASFLNLGATAGQIVNSKPDRLLLVCSGTLDQAAYEDVLGAGALCDLVWSSFNSGLISDSAQMARQLFLAAQHDLPGFISQSRNGRRLLSMTDLREDVAFCAQRDLMPLVAVLGKDGLVKRHYS